MKETYIVKEEDVAELAERVIHLLVARETSKAKVLLLGGDLGAGKTTFTKELASLLGIDKTKVTSPTFILKKEYEGDHSQFRKLIHVDAYRFNSPQEAKVLKLENDLGKSNALIAIEWPSKMKYPKADIELMFTVIDDVTREVDIVYEEPLL